MNIPLRTKSDADVSSNSSWSVISESEDCEFVSEENNIILECDSDSKNETEDNSFDICEGKAHEITESENEDNTGFVCLDRVTKTTKQTQLKNKSKKVKTKSKKPKKSRKKEKAETLSLLSIAASVLTITGITFLCMLFPQSFEKDTIENVQKTYIDAVTNKNANAENFLNRTAEMYDVVNETDFFKNMKTAINENDYLTQEEVCPIDETNNEDYKFDPHQTNFAPSPTFGPSEKQSEAEPSTSYQQVQNKTMVLIKNVKKILMDPNLQIFICTVLQDICLIKLVNQLNKQQVEKSVDSSEVSPEKLSVRSSKKKAATKITTLKSKPNVKINKKSHKVATVNDVTNSSLETPVRPFNVSIESKKLKEGLNNDSTVTVKLIKNEKENSKSECERKFEELDNKWEAAGHIHRQKVQEIKENFKNEIFHIKENEREFPLRRQRIQVLREKYIERLRLDREKYLYKLQKLREERQRIMKRLCQKKNNEVDLRDASVGNYTVLLPDTYNFQQKLQLLKNENHETRISLPSIPTASFPKIGAVKNSKFIKFQSIPNIPKQARPKLNISATTETFNAKKEKYLEKVKKYYEKKNNYLQKKALINKEHKNFDFTPKTVETIGEALIEDIISQMVSNIHELDKEVHESSSNSSVETVKASDSPSGNISSEAINVSDISTTSNRIEMGPINQGFKLVIKRKPKKRDLYDLAFEGKSKKVKQDDTVKWNLERKEKFYKLPQHQVLIKQDPQKAFKEKIIVRGHI